MKATKIYEFHIFFSAIPEIVLFPCRLFSSQERVPDPDYLRINSSLCRQMGALLIVDEIYTGFWQTGPAFASIAQGMEPHFMTLSKGIANGFPFAAVAVDANNRLYETVKFIFQ